MKCKICNCELTSGTAKCLKCGFPVLQMIKGDAAEEQKMNDLVKNFRKKKVEPVRIYLTVYKNAIEKDKVKVVETEKILLAKGDQMIGTEIIWYPEKFARLSRVGQIQLSVVHTNEQEKEVKVSMPVPNISDFWQVGVVPLDGMEFKLALGNVTTYSCSETISYL